MVLLRGRREDCDGSDVKEFCLEIVGVAVGTLLMLPCVSFALIFRSILKLCYIHKIFKIGLLLLPDLYSLSQFNFSWWLCDDCLIFTAEAMET